MSVSGLGRLASYRANGRRGRIVALALSNRQTVDEFAAFALKGGEHARRVASPAFAVALLVSLTAAGRAQSIRFGVGGGYTAAPSNANESSTGAWNAEAFLLLGLPVVPLDLRPTLFSYGRGTNTNLVVTNCPAIINTCPPTYASKAARSEPRVAQSMRSCDSAAVRLSLIWSAVPQRSW